MLRGTPRHHPLALSIALLVAFLPNLVFAQRGSPFESAPIRYSTTKATDPVARLVRRLESGSETLEFDEQYGYLISLLNKLNIPVSSQGLVFSKTSFQRVRISPKTPRAIYFNDEVYVGWIPNSDVMEISADDPQLGAVFYTLDQSEADRPKIKREIDSCMICHSSSLGRRVPGHLVRSLHVNMSGTPISGSVTYRTDHTSPLPERWGGWYVTGTHGEQTHMGNQLFRTVDEMHNPDWKAGGNIVDLTDRFDTARYPLPHSDIVALLVLEHQVTMKNLLTSASFQARTAIYHEEQANADREQETNDLSAETRLKISMLAAEVVDYMLFAEEAVLTDPIQGTSRFQSEFGGRGPRDRQGRSLFEFDLESRLFKYPCSYLIYSSSFDGLPKPLKSEIYLQLQKRLSAREPVGPHDILTRDDRQAILEILADTKSDFQG